jgi:hypothetical protein
MTKQQRATAKLSMQKILSGFQMANNKTKQKENRKRERRDKSKVNNRQEK